MIRPTVNPMIFVCFILCANLQTKHNTSAYNELSNKDSIADFVFYLLFDTAENTFICEGHY